MYGYPTKLFVPTVITLLNQENIFEWYIARLVVETRHLKDTCYNEIGQCAPTPF
jgi:hypothetical protein